MNLEESFVELCASLTEVGHVWTEEERMLFKRISRELSVIDARVKPSKYELDE